MYSNFQYTRRNRIDSSLLAIQKFYNFLNFTANIEFYFIPIILMFPLKLTINYRSAIVVQLLKENRFVVETSSSVRSDQANNETHSV